MVHCDTERLRLLLADQLPDSLQVEMAEHVASCESCRRTLESLAGDARWWSEVETCLRSGVAQERHSTGSSAVNSASEGEASGSADEFGVDFGIDFLDACDRDGALGRLGEYEILEVIGRGGMGVVLKGFHRELGRFVAVKVMAPHLASSGAARQRFIREARAAAAIVHSNVMPIHSVCTTARLPYLVMPFAACESLQQRIDRQGSLELKEILRIGVQAASGLAAAHAQGLVHRDVKPANILLEKGVDRVLLTDFGLARAADDGSLTRSGVVAGTPQYMSPEQSRGDPTDARSDLFSLGSVLYAAGAGHPPFRAETALGVLRRISDAEPRPIREVNPDVPAWLEGLVCRLHEKSPDRRFGSAAEVAGLLEQCLAHVHQPNVVPLPASLAPTSAIQPKRRRISQLKGTLAMIASIGICLLGSFLWQGSAKPRLADLSSTRLGEDEQSHDSVAKSGVVDPTLPGPLVATTPPRQSDSQTTPTEHKTNEVELEFTFPAGAVLAVNDDESLTSPGRLNLASRGLHVLTLRNIPDHPELKLTVVVAVWSIIPETEAYLRQHLVPLNLLTEDIQRAAAGDLVKKAVYLPHADRKHAETLVSSQLEPGVEPEEEAWRRGHVLVGLKVLPYPKAVAPLATSSTEHAANAERKPLILIGHADWVTGVAFSPDGKFVASSSRDKTVKVWEAATGLELLTLNRQVDNVNQRGDGYVQAVAFSPDGKKVASAGPGNNAVDVWNVVSGRRGRSHVRESIFMSVAFSPAGRLLAAANYNSVKVWDDDQDDPEGSNEILSLDASMPLSVAFSLDGKRLAAGGRDDKIKVWNTVTGEELLTVQNADQVLCVAFSPDGTRLASVCPTGVDVRDATTGKMVLMLNGLIGISGVAYSPDGKRLATAGWDKLVKLWDATTGQELRALKGHGNAVGGVAFSPDGKRLASSSKDRTVRIWDVAP
ncbi:MAG TPA: serine/threonine-protein kinase [Pirellulales bacterium]|nr:serine/threonine-protein kinase [Pirellulales bacterium]